MTIDEFIQVFTIGTVTGFGLSAFFGLIGKLISALKGLIFNN